MPIHFVNAVTMVHVATVRDSCSKSALVHAVTLVHTVTLVHAVTLVHVTVRDSCLKSTLRGLSCY